MSNLNPITLRDIRVGDLINKKSILGDNSIVEVTAEIIKEISEMPKNDKYFPLPITFEILDKIKNVDCIEHSDKEIVFENAVIHLRSNKNYPNFWTLFYKDTILGVVPYVHLFQQQYEFLVKQKLLFKEGLIGNNAIEYKSPVMQLVHWISENPDTHPDDYTDAISKAQMQYKLDIEATFNRARLMDKNEFKYKDFNDYKKRENAKI
jgi:hypothetical protein